MRYVTILMAILMVACSPEFDTDEKIRCVNTGDCLDGNVCQNGYCIPEGAVTDVVEDTGQDLPKIPDTTQDTSELDQRDQVDSEVEDTTDTSDEMQDQVNDSMPDTEPDTEPDIEDMDMEDWLETLSDSDGDQVPDWIEAQAGTNTLDPNDNPYANGDLIFIAPENGPVSPLQPDKLLRWDSERPVDLYFLFENDPSNTEMLSKLKAPCVGNGSDCGGSNREIDMWIDKLTCREYFVDGNGTQFISDKYLKGDNSAATAFIDSTNQNSVRARPKDGSFQAGEPLVLVDEPGGMPLGTISDLYRYSKPGTDCLGDLNIGWGTFKGSDQEHIQSPTSALDVFVPEEVQPNIPSSDFLKALECVIDESACTINSCDGSTSCAAFRSNAIKIVVPVIDSGANCTSQPCYEQQRVGSLAHSEGILLAGLFGGDLEKSSWEDLWDETESYTNSIMYWRSSVGNSNSDSFYTMVMGLVKRPRPLSWDLRLKSPATCSSNPFQGDTLVSNVEGCEELDSQGFYVPGQSLCWHVDVQSVCSATNEPQWNRWVLEIKEGTTVVAEKNIFIVTPPN